MDGGVGGSWLGFSRKRGKQKGKKRGREGEGKRPGIDYTNYYTILFFPSKTNVLVWETSLRSTSQTIPFALDTPLRTHDPHSFYDRILPFYYCTILPSPPTFSRPPTPLKFFLERITPERLLNDDTDDDSSPRPLFYKTGLIEVSFSLSRTQETVRLLSRTIRAS